MKSMGTAVVPSTHGSLPSVRQGRIYTQPNRRPLVGRSLRYVSSKACPHGLASCRSANSRQQLLPQHGLATGAGLSAVHAFSRRRQTLLTHISDKANGVVCAASRWVAAPDKGLPPQWVCSQAALPGGSLPCRVTTAVVTFAGVHCLAPVCCVMAQQQGPPPALFTKLTCSPAAAAPCRSSQRQHTGRPARSRRLPSTGNRAGAAPGYPPGTQEAVQELHPSRIPAQATQPGVPAAASASSTCTHTTSSSSSGYSSHIRQQHGGRSQPSSAHGC